MKSKITAFFLTIITLLAIGLLGIIAYNAYDYYMNNRVSSKVEEFVSDINYKVDRSKLMENIQVPEILQIEVSEPQKNNEVMNYSSIEINNHFYNQLNEYSKIIYNAMIVNKENMKSGTYTIDLGDQLSDLLLTEDGDELIGEYYQSAIEAYSYDNPDVFYIDFSKLYLNIETTTRRNKKTYKVSINCGKQENYLTSEFQSKEEIDYALNEMGKVRLYFVQNRREDLYEDIKAVHDYLVESIEYEQTISEPNIYNIYGALVNKKCVCEGYAKAFKYVMDALEIPCVVVAGPAINTDGNTENHAWNYVQLEGNWYAIDCTWDDPILIGTGFIPYTARYKYFMKGEKDFVKTHIPDGKFSDKGRVFEYPSLNYNNY